MSGEDSQFDLFLNTSNSDRPALTLRNQSLLAALVAGPLTREQADKVTRASNSPQHILELRKLGLRIDCVRGRFVDGEGVEHRPGTYYLHPESSASARGLLGGMI